MLTVILRLDLLSAAAFGLLAAVAVSDPIDPGIVTIVIAVIAAIVSLGTAAMTAVVLLRTGKIATSVDGMKTDLVAASIGKATAEGQLAGEQAQRDRGGVQAMKPLPPTEPPP